MSNLNKENFYNEVLHLLEEIEEKYDEHGFEEEYVDETSEHFAEEDALCRFINHVRDARSICENNV